MEQGTLRNIEGNRDPKMENSRLLNKQYNKAESRRNIGRRDRRRSDNQ